MGSSVKKSMLFVLLDGSGSMAGMETDVVGSINNFITDQRKLPDPAVIAVAEFSSAIPGMIKFIRPMGDLKEVNLLTKEDYLPGGGTPLLDATGKSIQALDADWARERPDRCVFVTFTDGHENASVESNRAKIKQMVEAREKSGLWSFLFLGTNIDSFAEGGSMGYTQNKMSNYVNSSIGTRSAIHKMSESVGTLRSMEAGAFASASVGNMDIGLGGDIAEDGSLSKASGLNGPGLGSSTIPSASIPPAAAMQQESWEAPTSSALFDPKTEAWKPPV